MPGLTLHITNAGKAKEIDALQNGTAISPIAKLAIGDGTAIVELADVVQLTQMVHKVYEISVEQPLRVNQVTLQVEAIIPEQVQVMIREVGLFLEDGTLFAYAAYAPYTPEKGGLKTRGYNFQLVAVLTRQESGDFNLTISPLDVAQLSQTIADRARQLLDEQVQSYVFPIVQGMSQLYLHSLKQQKLINDLETNMKRIS